MVPMNRIPGIIILWISYEVVQKCMTQVRGNIFMLNLVKDVIARLIK